MPASTSRRRRYGWPRSTTARALRSTAEDLTQSTREFDALLCIDVFEHVENPFEFLRMIRRLAPLVVFNIPLEMHVAGLLINHQLWTRRHYGHLHFYTAAVALQTLKECGYSVVGQSYISRLTALPRSLSEYVFWLPRKLISLFSEELLPACWGGRHYLSWLAVITREPVWLPIPQSIT